MARKQIVQFTSASAIAATDRLVLQQGTLGTGFTHGSVTQILNAGLAAEFSTVVANGTIAAGSDVTITGNLTQSRSVAITAAGTSQATATALTADINIVTTVAAGEGVVLADQDALVLNRGTVDLLVYPTSGAQIEAFGTNAAVTLAANTGQGQFIRSSATLFRVV